MDRGLVVLLSGVVVVWFAGVEGWVGFGGVGTLYMCMYALCVCVCGCGTRAILGTGRGSVFYWFRYASAFFFSLCKPSTTRKIVITIRIVSGG